MGFSVQNVCGFLIRGRLMTADEMRAMFQRWERTAGTEVDQLAAFLKWLVASGYVTEYQAALLGQGHAENFFLNQYKILERLGRGRMAGVFKAVHALGQAVAIKVLPPSRAKNALLLARFQREARLAMRLKHPNVVRSFHIGESNGVHYLVMEQLEGETIEELLRRRRMLPPSEACRLAHQTLLGLQHIHEQGMVHRDLKPANVFLATGGPDGNAAEPTVKILDIGLAREFFDETAPVDSEGETALTSEGMLLGTPDYLAPNKCATRAAATSGPTSTRSAACCTRCWSARRRLPIATCSNRSSGTPPRRPSRCAVSTRPCPKGWSRSSHG